MTLTHDKRFEYRGFHGCKSACRLRVYETPGKVPVALVTELTDNPGTSITNMAEYLATLIWKMLERPADGLVWIEHYEDRARVGGRTTLKNEFDRVTFEPRSDASGILTGFGEPHWQRISREEVETLLGQRVEPTLQRA